ncbi:hypothetical protein F7Q95_07670 [Pseudomonas psychrophila]|nr:hypothetical protein F7Q95_07670 [Pseudomonas psychrophila]
MLVWERACSRRHHCGLPERSRRLLREQARSHFKGCCLKSAYCLCLCCSHGTVQTTRTLITTLLAPHPDQTLPGICL